MKNVKNLMLFPMIYNLTKFKDFKILVQAGLIKSV